MLDFQINEDTDFIEIVDSNQTNYNDISTEANIKANINIKATYGTDELFYDVSNEVIFCFRSYDRLIILKEYAFNDYFGDPHYGKVKKLVLDINNTQYIINENRTTDFEFDLVENTLGKIRGALHPSPEPTKEIITI